MLCVYGVYMACIWRLYTWGHLSVVVQAGGWVGVICRAGDEDGAWSVCYRCVMVCVMGV